jgi:hypothetical protein
VPASGVVSLTANVLILHRFIGGRGESADQEKTKTISLNCGVTHSRGKIEYNCRYFFMALRKRIRKNKFSKNDFHTLQGTMSHRLLTNTSSLKITAAYCPSLLSQVAGLKVPKRENFLLAFFAQTKPIWVCDLENKKIKTFFLRLTPYFDSFWFFAAYRACGK